MQADAQRVGICLNDYEQFWWKADDDPTCPACSVDDDDYATRHRFFVAEEQADGSAFLKDCAETALRKSQSREQRLQEALREILRYAEDLPLGASPDAVGDAAAVERMARAALAEVQHGD